MSSGLLRTVMIICTDIFPVHSILFGIFHLLRYSKISSESLSLKHRTSKEINGIVLVSAQGGKIGLVMLTHRRGILFKLGVTEF